MRLILALIAALVESSFSRRISKTSCGKTVTFYRIGADLSLGGATLINRTVSSLEDCIDLCVDNENCKSFNVAKMSDGTFDCYLKRDDRMTKPENLLYKKGYSHYGTGNLALARSIGPRCEKMQQNPCPLHCSCVDTCESYRCDCDGGYNIFSSCEESLQKNPTADFHWILHVNMTKAVQVHCLVQSGVLYAIFPHDSSAEIYVNGFEPPASYKRVIKYSNNSLSDITAFADSSASCSQFLKLKCKNTLFTINNHGYVRDRNGNALKYIGGGPPNGIGCACGITGTCANPTRKCNCDLNGHSTTTDQGWFDDKSILPITEIRMGDTGSSGEYAYHFLGRLRCREN